MCRSAKWKSVRSDSSDSPQIDADYSMASGGDVGPLAVERNQVQALCRLRAKLTQHRRHLTAMIRAVVHEVLQHLPERLRLPPAIPTLILDGPRDAVGSESIQDRANAPLFVVPRGAKRGEIRVG